MKTKTFLFVTIISLLIGCEESVENSFKGVAPAGLVHWNVLSVEGPTIVEVNKAITFNVSCPATSGCDYVSTFVSDDSNGNTILIKAYGNTTKNTMCTQAAVPIVVKYEFTPHAKGQYVLKFINRDETIIKRSFTAN